MKAPLQTIITARERVEHMFERLRTRVKNALVSTGLFLGICAGILVFSIGIVSLPFTFGESLAILGIWLMLGVLFGQNKPAKMSLGRYVNRRALGVVICYAVFGIVGLIYMEHSHEAGDIAAEEVLGLLILALIGLAAGFLAGQDRETDE